MGWYGIRKKAKFSLDSLDHTDFTVPTDLSARPLLAGYLGLPVSIMKYETPHSRKAIKLLVYITCCVVGTQLLRETKT